MRVINFLLIWLNVFNLKIIFGIKIFGSKYLQESIVNK